MIVMVTGGARSGKSTFAEKWCMKHASSAIYIATAQAFDEEMKERIQRHQDQRNAEHYQWTTVEEPLALPDVLARLSASTTPSTPEAPTVLIDCLTLWLTNVLLTAGESEDSLSLVEKKIDHFLQASKEYPGRLIMVTNEVGSGIVPEYRLGRVYRDLAGILNRRVAEYAEEVYLVTAGIPIELKSRAYR
ncbi:adenosylcobinamide kinase/adenosylcobinamide-phosphate guanylyltransferase [Paenibacillus shirakamiensis]|uniref:Adenosylcobinamide kinase n=1 Tax=Paenibacillus shirakamiensis TaxID=1265935 RepID=A0ABS4JFP6_9BACL|nr:bifunctional adenosylcobinamide kinase/adenosylcobinamide-phosphate guanylyltransferase [Paenibacillus shirakamiensis]MBP2000527.1 adenosylcobinamide kinase/adenosylcobinamide-phosphate guanylyltransferase [Paenibacillus shirakamiensis]